MTVELDAVADVLVHGIFPGQDHQGAGAILAEAGLSFLGLGTQPPTPSWGSMLNEGRQFLFVSPHMTLAPGMAIMTVVLGLNFLGDALRDRFDVKREGPW